MKIIIVVLVLQLLFPLPLWGLYSRHLFPTLNPWHLLWLRVIYLNTPSPTLGNFPDHTSSPQLLLDVNSYSSYCSHHFSHYWLFFMHTWLISTYTEIINSLRTTLCPVCLIILSIFLVRDIHPKYIDFLLKGNITTAQQHWEINWP